jgi:ligand-binding sensor domain-containing protein
MNNDEMRKFDPKTGTLINQSSNQPGGMTYIAEDNSGNIWIKSFEGGLYVREISGHITRINFPSREEFNQQVYCIYSPPSSDTAWVGTLEGGIFSIAKKRKTISLIKSINTSIKCIFKDSFGLLWAGTKCWSASVRDLKSVCLI